MAWQGALELQGWALEIPGFRSLVTHCMGQSPLSFDLETLTSVGLVACHSRLYEADLCLNSVLVSTLHFCF